jgi:CelD/BcsL family acetyltransferase involved in cellulose biosynthesis
MNGASGLQLERLDLDGVDWPRLDAFPDRQIFETREWLAFLDETQRGEAVVCALSDGSEQLGFFTGYLVRRYGIRILGSPMPGWTTGYMGFDLEPGVSRAAAAEALVRYAREELGCAQIELRDRELPLQRLGQFNVDPFKTFEIDLTRSEDEIFNAMTSACRRAVRKGQKEGVVVEQASDIEFADDYYAQLVDVFAKQSLRPTYDLERVRALVRHLQPSGRLLLVRARNPEGKCIATGIFPALGRSMYFWGGASWREDQILRPNEAVFWFAIRYWKERGIEVFDMGGGGEYKRKYGGEELEVPHFSWSRFRALKTMRGVVRQLRSPSGLKSRLTKKVHRVPTRR